MSKRKKSKIVIPDNSSKVLLHTCCAPCSSAIIEWMQQHNIEPIIYYCNPNIYPFEEYEKRKNECIRYAKKLGLEFVEAVYDHASWRNYIKGLEKEPERGRRCQKCFEYRLNQASKYAKEHEIHIVTTALASSRWKSVEQVGRAGEKAAEQYEGVYYWNQNWRVDGLSERRSAIIKSFQFYNQQYCGCEFSLNQMLQHRASHSKEEKGK